jgi:hypothetical protein
MRIDLSGVWVNAGSAQLGGQAFRARSLCLCALPLGFCPCAFSLCALSLDLCPLLTS